MKEEDDEEEEGRRETVEDGLKFKVDVEVR
jgi:hypothetical protein